MRLSSLARGFLGLLFCFSLVMAFATPGLKADDNPFTMSNANVFTMKAAPACPCQDCQCGPGQCESGNCFSVVLAEVSDLHSHKCPNPTCGYVWSHRTSNASIGDHNCPKCGAFQDVQFEGGMSYVVADCANGQCARGSGGNFTYARSEYAASGKVRPLRKLLGIPFRILKRGSRGGCGGGGQQVATDDGIDFSRPAPAATPRNPFTVKPERVIATPAPVAVAAPSGHFEIRGTGRRAQSVWVSGNGSCASGQCANGSCPR